MMKTKNVITYLSISASIVALAISLFIWMNKPKTAYVDLGKVYNEFQLKKELEGKLLQVQTLRQNQIDSMKLDLNVLARNVQSENAANKTELQNRFIERRKQYAVKEKEFSEETDRLTQEYDEQLWKQLNTYVKEYGKDNNYKYIFGAEGSGSIMYASDVDNITDQIVTYVNTKYQGKPVK
jgi:outer membrane protein